MDKARARRERKKTSRTNRKKAVTPRGAARTKRRIAERMAAEVKGEGDANGVA